MTQIVAPYRQDQVKGDHDIRSSAAWGKAPGSPPWDSLPSDEVREEALGTAEEPHPAGKGQDGDRRGDQETRQVERARRPLHAPPKSVDHPDHGIEAVEQPPAFGHDGAGKPHGRDVEAELHQKGDDITEVPILHVQGGQPEPRPQGRQGREQKEKRHKQERPGGNEAISQHQPLKAIIASEETTLDEKRKAISFVVDRIEMKKDRTAVIYYRLPKSSIINENTSDIADVLSKSGAKQDFTQAPPREFESLFWP